jgi:hypothetical protein
LNFPPSKTLLDIKNDLFAVLKVPVRHQVWEGWPAYATNESKLSDLELNNIVPLRLKSTENGSGESSRTSATVRVDEPLEIDSDSDSIEFEDATADEDMFTEEGVQPSRLKHLSKEPYSTYKLHRS